MIFTIGDTRRTQNVHMNGSSALAHTLGDKWDSCPDNWIVNECSLALWALHTDCPLSSFLNASGSNGSCGLIYNQIYGIIFWVQFHPYRRLRKLYNIGDKGFYCYIFGGKTNGIWFAIDEWWSHRVYIQCFIHSDICILSKTSVFALIAFFSD